MCLALDTWHRSPEWMNDSEFVLSQEAERERGQLGERIPPLDGQWEPGSRVTSGARMRRFDAAKCTGLS